MRAEALKGHLDGMLLASLEAGPRHGYAIMEALRAGSGGQFDLPTGPLYPALRPLERARPVHGTWAEGRAGPGLGPPGRGRPGVPAPSPPPAGPAASRSRWSRPVR